MAKRHFSIGEALGETFRIAARRPLSVWVWGLIILLPVVAQFGFIFGALLDLPFQSFADAADQNDPAAFQNAMMPLMVQAQLGDALALLLRIVGGAALAAAVYRLVLKPAQAKGRPFALGLGMPELRVGVSYLAVVIGLAVFSGALILVLAGVGFGAWFGLTDTGRGWLVAALVFILLLTMLGAYARVCLIPPSCIADEDFAFETGWRRGAGNTGRLALLTLVIWLLMMVVGLAAYGVLGGIGWGVWAGLGLGGDWPSDPSSLREIVMHDPRILWLAVGLIFPLTWVYGLIFVLNTAPYASAVRQLTPEPAADAPVSGDASES